MCMARTQRRLAFRRFPSSFVISRFPVPFVDESNDDNRRRRGLLCFHDVAVPRLRIIDYRRVRWLIPRATWIRTARNMFWLCLSCDIPRGRIRVFARMGRTCLASFPLLLNIAVIVYTLAASYTAGHDFVHDGKGKVSTPRNTRKITEDT